MFGRLPVRVSLCASHFETNEIHQVECHRMRFCREFEIEGSPVSSLNFRENGSRCEQLN